jgi:hypothetical protein
MRDFIRGVFDYDCNKVLIAGISGGTIVSAVNTAVGILVGLLTAAYIGVKLFKQVRDLNKPDKD